MGSFNTTCAISRSPIRPNDKVRLFFISTKPFAYSEENDVETLRKNNIFVGSDHYSHDSFRVVCGIPLKCTYEDYNQYELINEDFFSDYVLDFIRKNYLHNPRPPADPDDYRSRSDEVRDVLPEDLSFANIIELVNDGHLFFKEDKEMVAYPMVNIMCIHEAVWQEYMSRSIKTYWWEEDGVQQGMGIRGVSDYVRKALKKYIVPDVTTTKNYKTMYELLIEEGVPHEKADRAAIIYATANTIDGDSYQEWSFTYNGNPIRAMFKFLEDKKSEHITTQDDIVTRVTEGQYFDIMMNNSLHKYVPAGTSGQEYDLTEYADNLISLATALRKTNCSNCTEDYFEFESVIESYNVITISHMKDKVHEWFDGNDDLLAFWGEFIADLENEAKVRGKDYVVITREMLNTPEEEYEALRDAMGSELDVRIYMK